MKFLELRQRLAELSRDRRYSRASPDRIWWDRYDGGKGIPGEERWHLRQDGERYLVSWLERDEFHFTESFDSEEAACEWLLEKFSVIPPPAGCTPESEIDSRMAQFRENMDTERATWPTWADVEGKKDGS